MPDNIRRARRGSELSETPPGWVWNERQILGRGELNMVVGRDGMGKSSFLLSAAADLTTRDEPEVCFMSMQEDDELEVKSRLRVHGADLAQCVFQGPRADDSPNMH